MSKCENCRLRKESAKAFDIHWHDEVDCPYAHCPVPDFPQTHADRIRAMTDEELAKTFYTGCENRAYNDACLVTQELIVRGDLAISDEEQDEICLKCWLDWLKAPAEVEK